MRIVDIALFILIFNLMMGVVTQANYAGGTSIEYNSTIEGLSDEAINQTIEELKNETTGASTWEVMVWQFEMTVIKPIKFLLGLGKAALITGDYIQEFIPIPNSLALAITSIIDIIYVIGVIEFVSGRRV